MKKVLIELATGRMCDIVDDGTEFSVAEGLEWADAPDDVTHSTHYFDGVAVAVKPPPTPDEIARQEAAATLVAQRTEVKTDAFVQQFVDMTPQEVRAYVTANATDLAGARALLSRLAVMMLILAKQNYR